VRNRAVDSGPEFASFVRARSDFRDKIEFRIT